MASTNLKFRTNVSKLLCKLCRNSKNYVGNSFSFWRCGPTRSMASSLLRFLGQTQQRITVGRTPLDEWSARRRDLWQHTTLTTDKQPCPGGIRTHDLSRKVAADLHLRPRGYFFFFYWIVSGTGMLVTVKYLNSCCVKLLCVCVDRCTNNISLKYFIFNTFPIFIHRLQWFH